MSLLLTAGGITAVVEAQIYKGQENTVYITMPVTPPVTLHELPDDVPGVPGAEFPLSAAGPDNTPVGLSLLIAATGVCAIAVASKRYARSRK